MGINMHNPTLEFILLRTAYSEEKLGWGYEIASETMGTGPNNHIILRVGVPQENYGQEGAE